MDILPLFLREAILTLYAVDSNGNPITSAPVWVGALATGLNLKYSFEEELSYASGDTYKTAHHTDELHSIEITRNWFIQKTAPAVNANPTRNTSYVLSIVWSSQDELNVWYWFSRVYYGVTARSMDLNSSGTKHFVQPQTLRATHFITNGGQGQPSTLPPTSLNAIDEPLSIKEDPLMTGDYFMGTYAWPTNRTILSASIIALAPQVTPVVVTLEVGGILTATTMTIPLGTANTYVDATANNINLVITQGQTMRWKVTSAPADPGNTAYQAGIVTEVQ